MKQDIYKPTNKIIRKGDTMIDIDKIKQEVQGNTDYMVGLRIVTFERPDAILHTIRKDKIAYGKIRAVVGEKTIKIGLDNNATVAVFYFMDKVTFNMVVTQLEAEDISVVKT